MKLSDLGEFGLIARLRARWPQSPAGVVVGPGDDAAAVQPDQGRLLLFTVDAMVEDVHFRRRWMPPRDLGWKAMAQSLSDIAAMGGQPTHALVCLSLPVPSAVEGPGDLDAGFVDALYDGLDAAAAEYGASVIGGDIVGSTGGVMVSVSLLGEVEEGLLLRRSGARPGEVLMVTGALGDAAAGLRLLEAGESPAAGEESAVTRHLRPAPRVDEARILARSGQVTAAIDLSDGLAGDAAHIAEESGVGVRLHGERLPVGAACKQVAARLRLNPLPLALRGGEDYELLVAVRPQAAEGLAELLHHETGTALTAVGEVVEAARGVVLIAADGIEATLGGAFDHFGEPSDR
ncbi:MAG TPA: thiamine-phosphate kinase [Armatimonadota bacterium]|nr:thiamine-phosphate kinase [Armatimonadota bacterium]